MAETKSVAQTAAALGDLRERRVEGAVVLIP
jgi:hypothetical protein